MDAFGRTQIEHPSVPRMMPGTNWFLGCTHTTRAKDRLVGEIMTGRRIADILEAFVNAGIVGRTRFVADHAVSGPGARGLRDPSRLGRQAGA